MQGCITFCILSENISSCLDQRLHGRLQSAPLSHQMQGRVAFNIGSRQRLSYRFISIFTFKG